MRRSSPVVQWVRQRVAGHAVRLMALVGASLVGASSAAAQGRITAPVESLPPVIVRVGQTRPVVREITVTLQSSLTTLKWQAVVKGASAAGFTATAQPAPSPGNPTDSLVPGVPRLLVLEWRGTGLKPGVSRDTLLVTAPGADTLRLVYSATVLGSDTLRVLQTPSPLDPARRLPGDSLGRAVRVFALDAPVELAWPVEGISGTTGGAAPIIGLRVFSASGVSDTVPAPWIVSSLDRTVTPAVLRLSISAPPGARIGEVVRGAIILRADSSQGLTSSRLRLPLHVQVRPPRAALRLTPGEAIVATVSRADTVVRWTLSADGVGDTGRGRFERMRVRVIEGQRAAWVRAAWGSGSPEGMAPSQVVVEAFPGALPPNGAWVDATVEVMDEEALAPVTVPVRLRVGPAPVLGRGGSGDGGMGDTLTVRLAAAQDTVVDIPVVNRAALPDGTGAGDIGDLSVEVVPGTLDGGPPPRWIAASLTATRTPSLLRLRLDRRALAGVDTTREVWARVIVRSGGAGVAPWTLLVRVDPRATPPLPPEVVPSPRLQWATTPGEGVRTDTIALDAAGAAWQLTPPAPPSWLDVRLTATGRALIVSPRVDLLSPGTRTARFELRRGTEPAIVLEATSRILAPPTTAAVLRAWRQPPASGGASAVLSDLDIWLDWRGNRNHRLDLGDVAAYLQRQP